MSNTSLTPITLYPWVYCLECEPRAGTNYPSVYFGVSLDTHRRIQQHLDGNGSRFTKAHPVRRVISIDIDTGRSGEGALRRETEAVLQKMREYITQHGADAWRSVAGGNYPMPHTQQRPPRDL